jgi:antitoxin ParD1/3/4
MNLSLGRHWDQFLDQLIGTGRYSSASEAVRDGLRLLQQEEQKRLALKSYLDDAIAKGGTITDEDVEAALEADLLKLQKSGKVR